MGQQRDPSSETDSDPVGEAPPSFLQRYFWAFLGGAVLLATGAGAAVAYAQYEQVDRTLRSVPYGDQAVQHARRLASALPYVGTSEDEQQSYGSFTRMKGLVVNPAGSDGTRYLAASIAFESKSVGVRAEIENKKVVVKDTILTLLSEQTAKELSDPNRRGKLKEKLVGATNHVLSGGTVDRLYFTEFVLQ